ncbi:MAG: hypothetical protein R3E90_11700 [Marinicella sp.]
MKKKMKQWAKHGLALMGFIGTASAINLGALDDTFSQDGTTDGWDLSGQPGYHWYGSDVAVDSQGRILIAGTHQYDLNGNTELVARVERRLPDGTLDHSFDFDGIMDLGIPPAPQAQLNYEIIMDSSDGVFVGYSRLYCQATNDCESDLYVYHINVNGVIVGNQQIDFDLGATNDRRDDDFADMVYVPSINKLAITAEVELSNANDTDYGIAVLNADPVSGALSIDTGFSVDGKRQCYFDQNNVSGSRDMPTAIVWYGPTNSFIVGGSTFEGNGLNSDGWNMSFCEFNLAGDLVRSWSTISQGIAIDSREFLNDLVVYQEPVLGGNSYLIGTGALPGAGEFDSVVFRYKMNQISQWELDSSFGTNGTGYETTGFQYIFQGDTRDFGVNMLLEEDGQILVLSSISWDESGQPKSAFGLSKYTVDGHLNTNWGIAKTGKAVHTFDISVRWDIAEAVTIDPITEEIYVTGMSYDGLNFKSTVANMHNDSIFASNFDF